MPIAWIDSEAASTTTDLQPYLPMLKAIVKMNRKYFPKQQQADEFASLINSWTESDFNNILENIPLEIVRREPLEFTDYNKVSAVDFK